MGAEGAYIPLIAAAIGAGGGIGTALLTPSAQERRSYAGTTFDPVNINSEAHNLITSQIGGAIARANAPIDLPNAVVQPLPTFTGGGLPTPIGTTGRPGAGISPGAPGLKPPGSPEIPGHTPLPTDPAPPRRLPSDPPPPPVVDPKAPVVTFPPGGDEGGDGGGDDGSGVPAPTGPPKRRTLSTLPTSTADALSALPQRLSVKPARGGYTAGGGSGAPAVPNLSPQARGAVQLLLHSITSGAGTGAGGGASAGYR